MTVVVTTDSLNTEATGTVVITDIAKDAVFQVEMNELLSRASTSDLP